MNGPLPCKACRVLLEEDKAHEKEQQEYNDKRQARYAAQLAGTAEAEKDPTQGIQKKGEQRRTTPVIVHGSQLTSKKIRRRMGISPKLCAHQPGTTV